MRAATRGSPLALRQTELVAALLGVPVDTVIVETAGDQRRDVPIREIGGRGVFVKEVQAAVLDGRADFAVHSAKDLQSTPTEGLVIGAVPEREDPRDALVGNTLAGLPPGSRVGTGSVRRRVQLTARRPDLTFAELRGNIGTRIDKASEFGAVVVAYAALRRLGREAEATEVLEPAVMLPQVAQGALAIECRADDAETLRRLQAIEHAATRAAVDAERAFLAELGGGCDLPVGAYATLEGSRQITVRGLVASLDGRIVLRHAATGDDPVTVGREVAGHLLDGAGGRALLEGSSAP